LITQSEVWSQTLSETLSESLSPNEKRLHFLADLWSQSEFKTQGKSQQKTDPKSEMTHRRLRAVNSDEYTFRWLLQAWLMNIHLSRRQWPSAAILTVLWRLSCLFIFVIY